MSDDRTSRFTWTSAQSRWITVDAVIVCQFTFRAGAMCVRDKRTRRIGKGATLARSPLRGSLERPCPFGIPRISRWDLCAQCARKIGRRWKEPLPMLPKKQPSKSPSCSSLTVPELDQSKTTVLNTLASAHSRRSYKHAIEKFIAWYCAEPRLGFIDPSWCDTARSLRVFPCLPLRSIFIFAPSGAWPMRLRRVVG
jgi:hypothetical protein